jgi:NAD-dependent SIR2 family protein deacetylase
MGLSLASMSESSWFVKDPQLAWGFYSHRAQLYRNAQPHDGFMALKRMAEVILSIFLFFAFVS